MKKLFIYRTIEEIICYSLTLIYLLKFTLISISHILKICLRREHWFEVIFSLYFLSWIFVCFFFCILFHSLSVVFVSNEILYNFNFIILPFFNLWWLNFWIWLFGFFCQLLFLFLLFLLLNRVNFFFRFFSFDAIFKSWKYSFILRECLFDILF